MVCSPAPCHIAALAHAQGKANASSQQGHFAENPSASRALLPCDRNGGVAYSGDSDHPFFAGSVGSVAAEFKHGRLE